MIPLVTWHDLVEVGQSPTNLPLVYLVRAAYFKIIGKTLLLIKFIQYQFTNPDQDIRALINFTIKPKLSYENRY